VERRRKEKMESKSIKLDRQAADREIRDRNLKGLEH
jgi:hypothetical protein